MDFVGFNIILTLMNALSVKTAILCMGECFGFKKGKNGGGLEECFLHCSENHRDSTEDENVNEIEAKFCTL